MASKTKYPDFCKRRGSWNIDAIKDCNQRAGQFFFSPDTLKFFRSRVSDKTHQGKGGVYFVTSEQFSFRGQRDARKYTVRRFFPKTGKVDTVGDHQEYNTATAAQKAAKKLAR